MGISSLSSLWIIDIPVVAAGVRAIGVVVVDVVVVMEVGGGA